MKTCVPFILIVSSSAMALAETIYVPDSSFGNSSSGIPFNYSPSVSLRLQQVYGASAFSSLDTGGTWITGLAFRFEDKSGRTLSGSVSNVQINLSTSLKSVDGLSTTFSQNVGIDDIKVFGPSAVGWDNTPSPDFTVGFHFTTPFFYNPTMGNLLVDTRVFNSGQAFPSLGSMEMDASNINGDSISIVYGFGVNSLTGTADTLGLVTAFEVTPVPEPGGVWIFLMGAALVGLVWKRRISAVRGDDVEQGIQAAQSFW